MSTTSSPIIRQLTGAELSQHLETLSQILVQTVAAGASVGFIMPFTSTDAGAFWQDRVFPAVERGDALLFGAFLEGKLQGTVQLVIALPPNQPHRGDVAKLLVHPEARRAGLGRALMLRLEEEARRLGKVLLVLDTRSGDPSQRLYEGLGYQVAGSIPGFCRNPRTETYEATTYLYKSLN
ncbi:GNAT family N-acetyltransferase [Pseudophaeobacter sp. EL27]|uniref:GNAT family N-acetyltransferase n=1 Tax=Pseudophaeobacter sp. EL27 TaxID=2107580 RepID=UPI000EFAB64A|nr:GNAT family N-acetyltransferase [Pseudophaeobacter sp. EL27]